MIAALYVDPRGCYAGLPWVDLWDEQRDARRYEGPWPVVAHPPCGRWCRLAGLVAARYPDRLDLQPGQDGGTFAAALAAVRRWGGVLEHPAYSDAWAAHDLLPPVRRRWRGPDKYGGYTATVRQFDYGHPAIKRTWLYAVAPRDKLPPLWERRRKGAQSAYVSFCDNHTSSAMVGRTYRESPRPGVIADKRRRLSKREAAATPPAFRNALLAIAASCSAPQLDGARTAPVAPDGSDPTPDSPGGETASVPALRGSKQHDKMAGGIKTEGNRVGRCRAK